MRVLVPGRDRPYVDGDSLDLSAPLAFTLDNVLTEPECAALIDRIETLGPSAAPITTSAGFVMRPDIRNNERVMFDDVALAKDLFGRIVASVPSPLCGMEPVGANERFRCYRYTPGQRFAPHYDGAFERDDRERSLLTYIVYLNDGFEGVRQRSSTSMSWQFHDLAVHCCFSTSCCTRELASDRGPNMFCAPTSCTVES